MSVKITNLKRILVTTLIVVSVNAAFIGCGHKDPLYSAAPPVSRDAVGLGNAAGTKPTAGTAAPTLLSGTTNTGTAIPKAAPKP